MSIDPTDPRSSSRQIADALREEIVSGRIVPGERLPSESRLVETYGTASQTVKQAIGLLKAEGLVEGRKGSGVYVRQAPVITRVDMSRFSRSKRAAGRAAQQAEAEAAGLSWKQEVLHLGEVPAPAWVAELYAIAEGDPVFVRRRREWVGDQPNQLADSYYRPEVVEGTAIQELKTGPGGSLARLEEAGHRIVRFREQLRTRMPSPEEVRSLRLAEGVPVVRMRRVTFAESGPVEVFESIMAGDRFEFTYEFDAPE
ncbi:GntR family transcriptional regulator [Catenulispora rubra]|uniref:GntR family transcriptional regulator n=1 Tax=Catenulispora rubra TaxID=280293 RepID=UPI00189277A6|nr:GntR family transcriptional regulator [Catenulispora rubra]